MEITRVVNDPNGSGPGRPAQTITIVIEPGEDPLAHLNGLFVTGRLEAFLRVYSGVNAAEPRDKEDAQTLLVRFGFVANMVTANLNDLLWASRDTIGLSWRTMATLTEQPPSTVRRWVDKWRTRSADSGYWRDANGLHKGTVADAKAVAAAVIDGEDSD